MIKLVTVLFADVVGSTSHAERMHPEDVRAHMADFLEAMSQEITAEGGTVERYVGDAIMADFGVPIAHEDDPLRAVKAARRMLARLEEWNAGQSSEARIQIRIGINTGEVSTGGTFGEQLMVMGDAVNVAARLQQTAEPGTIVVGERTARFVRDIFQLSDRARLELKGKTDPIAAFVVGEEISPADSRRADEFAGPMVGRVAELKLLDASFEKVAREATPLLVAVIGDPGVGKSRLVAEFLGTLEGQARVIAGRCLPYGEGVTLWPFREILRAEAGVIGSDPPEVAIENVTKLAHSITDPHQHPERMTAALVSTLGIEESTGLMTLDPREVQRELLRAWRALLIDRARERPLVVLVEDLHWADEATLSVLEDVVENAVAPILFLCPARPELTSSRAEWIGGLKYYTALPLDSLDIDSSTELVSELLDIEHVPEELWFRILRKAEGNPFFLEEIIRRLVDQGHLVPSNGRWKAGDEVEEVDIPDNVHAVILSRIDLLPPSEKEVIQKAAVVGRTFWPVLLQQLTGIEDIDQTMRSLKSRQLISERPISSLAGETEYAFKHVLIREVAYESLPRRARGEAHADIADWIEGMRGQRTDEVAEILAHHFDHAFKWLDDDAMRERARAYYLIAARGAVNRFATQQAERLGRRAVDLSTEGRQRVDALQALGDLYSLTFKSDGAWQAYTEAIAELESTDPTDQQTFAHLAGKAAVVPTRWWGTMEKLPDEDELQRLVSRGLEGAGPTDSQARALLLASAGFARNLPYSFGSEGAKAARESLDIARRLDDPDLQSLAMDAVVACLFPEGRWTEIHKINLERIELVPRLKDMREICDAYGMAAVASIRKGLYKEGARFADMEISRARDFDAGSYMQGLVWREVARFRLGQWDEGFEDQRELEGLRIDQSEPPGPMAQRAYTSAMFCHDLRGETDTADAYLELLERSIEKERAGGFTMGGLPDAARMLAHRGEFERAKDLLSTERNDFLGLHLEAFCEVLRLQEDWDEANRLLPLIRDEAEREGLLMLDYLADRLEGAMRGANQDVERAQTLLKRSIDGFRDLDIQWEEAVSRLLLAEATAGAGDPSIAAEARAASTVFERLNSINELRRAQKLQ